MKRSSFIRKVFITKSYSETQKLGYSFAKVLKKGDVICLYGELGSGKTTFIQGLAKGLGIKNRIISPTFIMVRNYKLKALNFYHLDLYRAEGKEAIEGLGINEITNNMNNIVAIEWAEKLESYLPEKRIDIKFYYQGGNARKIVFRSLNQ